MTDRLPRRRFLRLAAAGAGLAGAAAALGSALAATLTDADRGRVLPNRPFSFTEHERDSVAAAADRLIPPCTDTFTAFPGAAAAGAPAYIETLLGAFNEPSQPPQIYLTGWPKSLADPPTIPAIYMDLPAAKRIGWEREVQRLQKLYILGLRELDAADPLGRPFVQLSPIEQTAVLETFDQAGTVRRVGGATVGAEESDPEKLPTDDLRAAFFDALFDHTMEGVYGDPAYGGNVGRAGWQAIRYEGPVLPVGYGDQELREFGENPTPTSSDVITTILKSMRKLPLK